MSKRLKKIAINLSMLLNFSLGGELNQTFSARSWESKRNNKFNLVFLLDTLLGSGHCARAWVYWQVKR